MDIYEWKEGMSEKEMRDGAYWERNMLALHSGIKMNNMIARLREYSAKAGLEVPEERPYCGWYMHGEWEGWSRVISLAFGTVTFHVPDDFDLGDLPQIEPNWDGQTTKQKWSRMMQECGCNIPFQFTPYMNSMKPDDKKLESPEELTKRRVMILQAGITVGKRNPIGYTDTCWWIDQHYTDGWSRLVFTNPSDTTGICFHVPDWMDLGEIPEAKEYTHRITTNDICVCPTCKSV